MKTTLTLDVEYDDQVTDPESIASAADRLMETALSTPGIMEEYGDPRFGEFFVAPADKTRPSIDEAVEAFIHDNSSDTPRGLRDAFEAGWKAALTGPAGIECQQAQEGRHRWVLYDLATDDLLGTRVYNEHAEAVEAAAQADDVLVLPLAIPGQRQVNRGEEPDRE